MNRTDFTNAIAAHGCAIALIRAADDKLLVLPGESALAWRRAEQLAADGDLILGAYEGPLAWEYLCEDRVYALNDERVAA